LAGGEPPLAHSRLISLDILDMAEFFQLEPALVPVMKPNVLDRAL
jgi:hypothetical protein